MIAVVLIAGIAGAVIRYSVNRWSVGRWSGSGTTASRHQLPWAVLMVNTVGSLIGGAALGLSTTGIISPDWRLVLLTGFCGGLTTFSTFSVETIQLAIDGRWRVAIGSVAANLVLGIGAAAAAYAIVVVRA